jgi:hypothetical protein
MKWVTGLWIGVLFFALLTLGAAAPVAAEVPELNDSQEPGSVLVFPYFRTGTVPSSESMETPKTQLEISVTCPRGTSCVKGDNNTGEAVRLRAHWVCPGGALDKCEEVNFNLSTTVNGTVFFNPDNAPGMSTPSNTGLRNATVPPPPCPRGFLIVWVIDQFDRPIKYDGLIGSAVIREGTRSAVGYNALPIQAASGLAARAPTDENPGPGGFNGKLDFNGSEYKAITGKIFGTLRYENAAFPTLSIGQTRLILLTLDAVSNLPNERTFVNLDFFKTDETLVSDSVDFVCWTRVRLTDINPDLIIANMGRKGLVESTAVVQGSVQTGFRSVTLVGLVQTDERTGADIIERDWIYSLYNDSCPVPTTFTPSGSP